MLTGCSLVADIALFNSRFNRDSFLDNIESFVHTMPDCRPKGLHDELVSKCHVLYYPIQFVESVQLSHQSCTSNTAGCGGAVARQPVEASNCIADSSVYTVGTVCDTDSHADTADSHVDSRADTDDVVCLPASLPVNYEALHIVWPHRWYVHCLSVLSQKKERQHLWQ